jgi:hypothetical protein
MDALEYVKKFKMDQPNYQFKRQLFIDSLGKEFRETVYNPENGYEPISKTLSIDRFREIVDSFYQKFKTISTIKAKVGEPLTQGLWNAFFAQTVCKVRAELYPEEAKRIKIIIERRENNNIQCRRKQDKKVRARKTWVI